MKKDLKYTDSIFHDVILTGRYIKKMAEQVFKKLELKLTNEEFSVLDFLYKNDEQICQRDLAIKLLYNRANIGKILNNLEKTGYIKRQIGEKQNYPVKFVFLTKNGEKIYTETANKLREVASSPLEAISKDEVKNMSLMLKKMRNIIEEVVEFNI